MSALTRMLKRWFGIQHSEQDAQEAERLHDHRASRRAAKLRPLFARQLEEIEREAARNIIHDHDLYH